jgi:N-succinyldiaminopimelate aminotransferase
MNPNFNMARRVAGFGTTIFSDINVLAERHSAVNLGQGAPDFDGPSAVLAAAVQALNGQLNQYAPGLGMPSVREAIASHAARFYGQKLDASTQVVVTSGATEAVFAAILGLTDPGDEAVVFQPVYDTYVPNLVMAGVTPRYVTLRGDEWTFDEAELASAFNQRTRIIIVNTPHNPTGKVYSREELSVVAGLCRKHDVIALCDEVYEHILYDGVPHTRLAMLPGMAERTLTVSSLGKTFSVTGWKVGWAMGPPVLVNALNQAHQFITFSVASPLQAAALTALGLPDSFFDNLQMTYQAKRDVVLNMLHKAGFRVFKPQGGYFIMVDWRGVAPAAVEDDVQFAKWLIEKIGVACIPPSFFYQDPDKHLGRYLARFAICKKDETLTAAAERLSRLGRS